MNLRKIHTQLLKALAGGDTLKSHRHFDGGKEYKLHPLFGPPQPVQRAAVEYLCDQGLIHSNQKFPAATYLLTERGQKAANRLISVTPRPVSAKNFKP